MTASGGSKSKVFSAVSIADRVPGVHPGAATCFRLDAIPGRESFSSVSPEQLLSGNHCRMCTGVVLGRSPPK